jgi:hypothetical protein
MPDDLVLAAVERAERHGERRGALFGSCRNTSPHRSARGERVRYGDFKEWLEGNRYHASESVTQNVTVPATVNFRW